MALNHLLVETNIFKKVKLSFLPVGHTHDDVDQFFSKINAVLLRRNILTIADLHTAVTDSFHPTPVCTHLDNMGMFVPWFEKVMVNNVTGITLPRCFLFKHTGKELERRGIFERTGKEDLGIVGQFYRQQMQTTKVALEDCWLPSNMPSGFQCFKGNLDREDMGPVFKVPYKSLDMANLKITVLSMGSLMSSEQTKWWNDLLEGLQEQDATGCMECQILRDEQKTNASSKLDSKELKNKKQKNMRKSLKNLQLHMGENSSTHAQYTNFWPPSNAAAEGCAQNQGSF